MRDIKGDNNGIIIDKSKTIIVKPNQEYKDSKIEKEETTLGTIIKEKVIEALVGAILTGIATLIKNCQADGGLDTLENNIALCLIIMMIVFFILGVGLLFIFLIDMIKILSLSKRGNFVELESKYEWVSKLLEAFSSAESDSYKDTRTVGKCYKNVEGRIYRIKGKKCPLCETEPIGDMHLRYLNSANVYFWQCSQIQVHKIEFDYKKKM